MKPPAQREACEDVSNSNREDTNTPARSSERPIRSRHKLYLLKVYSQDGTFSLSRVPEILSALHNAISSGKFPAAALRTVAKGVRLLRRGLLTIKPNGELEQDGR